MRRKITILLCLALIGGLLGLPGGASGVPAAGQSNKKCVDGRAGFFPCKNVDLMAFVPTADFGGGEASDIVGWADPKSKREFALMGSSQGVKFFDITNPTHPLFFGTLLKPEKSLVWQDIEVFKDHAFVVCDLSPCGMEIFDLTRLLDAQGGAQTWTPDLDYPVSASTHTIDIDPATGLAFLNGSYLSGGSHIVDVNNPLTPIPVGMNQDDGYTHDSHCRTYTGDDKEHKGHEVCFNANEDTITIYDMANPTAPVRLSRTIYKHATYTHQAWLTKDGNHILVSDEIDEETYHYNSTTYIFDVSDLEKPKLIGTYQSNNKSIDHNNYIVGDIDYQASYTAGLRVIDVSKVAQAKLKEVGFFDVVPESDEANYDGSWGVWPFLPSGNVLVSGMNQGFFVVRPQGNLAPKN